MTARGTWTIARLELTQRARTSRWPVVLGVWFVVIGGLTTLAYYATRDSMVNTGRIMYDLTTFFVLGLAMLVVPALTATSVNGDREVGVLATLQTTLLTPADIIVGKLLASWLVALVFLATTLPFLFWAWVVGGVGVGSVLMSLLVLVLVQAVVCAIGLMFSTLTARPVASAVLTYCVVAYLALGTALTFFLAFPLVSTQEQVRYYGIPDSWWQQQPQPAATDPTGPTGPTGPPDPTVADCRHLTRLGDVPHTERIWWLLSVNPFVVVADAGPGPRTTANGDGDDFTPMRAMSDGVRSARQGPEDAERQECWFSEGGQLPGPPEGGRRPEAGAVWPVGLAALLLGGAGATLVAIRRTRTPIRRLPNGTRIA